MALVICDMSTSLDGYVTGPNDSRQNPFGDGAGMLHNWMFDAATDVDRAILQEMLDGVGAIVMGRKSFDKNEGDGGWGDGGPVGDTPCFVVTHNRPTGSYPPVYTFVIDGVVSAIEQAKQVAGDRVVGLHGATVMQQALPLGLVDEIRVHVIPVLLGGGTPLFATLDSAITLERTQVLVTPAATHLTFSGGAVTARRRGVRPRATRHPPHSIRSPVTGSSRDRIAGRAARTADRWPSPGLWMCWLRALGEVGEEFRQTAGAKVVEAHPAWLDRDARHPVVHGPDLLLELGGLLGVEELLRPGDVLVGDTVDDLHARSAAHRQRLGRVGPVAGVDAQRDVRAGGQRRDLR